MQYLVSGSREFPDEALARAIFRHYFKIGDIVYAGAARGVDAWATEEAKAVGACVREFPADWGTHGRAAGPIRNKAMLDAAMRVGSPLYAIILWDGKSRGTQNMLDHVTINGVQHVLVTVEL